LIEEDIQEFNEALDELLEQSEATVGLVLDKGGFVITQYGEFEDFDLMSLAALAAGSFAATQSLAELVGERDFNSMYQQGDTNSMLIMNVDEFCLLTVVFPARISVGAVKYFAVDAAKIIARQLRKAKKRNPEGGLDLSMLNLADTKGIFQKKAV